jgi:hypothetical protein
MNEGKIDVMVEHLIAGPYQRPLFSTEIKTPKKKKYQ